MIASNHNKINYIHRPDVDTQPEINVGVHCRLSARVLQSHTACTGSPESGAALVMIVTFFTWPLLFPGNFLLSLAQRTPLRLIAGSKCSTTGAPLVRKGRQFPMKV
jgi:hypothetical protein